MRKCVPSSPGRVLDDPGLRPVQTQRITERAWQESTVPVVSIACAAYNQKQFIRECLDGFLIQETTFPVEILIHDDASTDGTADIIRDYEARHPDLIRTIYQTENQYSKGIKPHKHFLSVMAKGKYIALCEGDDYWTDPLKLEKQVKLMESNADAAICFHKVAILKNDKLVDDFITRVPAPRTTIADLALENYIHTPSCVYRNRGPAIFGPNFDSSPLGDYYLHFINAQYGNIYHIDETMAVYRAHNESIWSNKSELLRIAQTQEARKAILKDLSDDQVDVKQLLAKQHIEVALSVCSQYPSERSLESMIITESSIYTLQLSALLFHLYSAHKEIQEGKSGLRIIGKQLLLALRIKLRHLTRSVIEKVSPQKD